jgi:hypothetical protein
VSAQNTNTATSGSGRGTAGGATANASAQSAVTMVEMTSVVTYAISISATLKPTKAVTDRDPTPAELDHADTAQDVGDVTSALDPMSLLLHTGMALATQPRAKIRAARDRIESHKPQNKSAHAATVSKIVVKIPVDACTKTTKRFQDFDP